MDNYGSHITAKVLAWAKTHNVCFYLTPTNGSWLNRIESQFTALKKFALQPSDFPSHEEQQAAIESYLAWRNRTATFPSPRGMSPQQKRPMRLEVAQAKLAKVKRH